MQDHPDSDASKRVLREVALWMAIALLSAGGNALYAGPGDDEGAVPAETEASAADDAAPEGEEAKKDEDTDKKAFQETVVVTASRTDQNILEAPASVSVISAEELEQSGADNYGELLRRVPGMQVVQFGTRDVQLTARAATSSLATGNLVLVDGRSIYLDFFGVVLWDFVPTDFNELDQIEVVRGPGSSMWGANAFTGVVNIRTKKPQDMQGTVVKIGGGEQATHTLSVVHAGANDAGDLGWKISASYYEQNPWPREPRTLANGGVITPLPDNGTEQPKLDFRLTRDLSDNSGWDFGIGGSRTSGIINTGIGPFDIDDSSGFYYTRFEYQRKQLKATGYVNVLDGDTVALLTVGVTGAPLEFQFDTDTIDLSIQNGHLLGSRQRLTYGGNVRRADHDLSIAPEADKREEIGAFIEDELHISDHLRLFLGVRIDDFDVVDTVVSPRVSLVFLVNKSNTFRISANRAFRAPSLVNEFLDTTILQRADLTLLGDGVLVFPVLAEGNRSIEEETVDAFDAAFNHVWPGGHLDVSVYYHKSEDLIDFRPVEFYTSAAPPPGWPLPPSLLDTTIFLPSRFSYVNIAQVKDIGAELSVTQTLNRLVTVFGSYSYANKPRVSDDDPLFAINIPPMHKVVLGFGFGGQQNSGSVELSYTDTAFWSDVLDSRFFGTTSEYLLVNTRWTHHFNDVASYSVAITNLFDEDTPRHIFGDNIGRRAIGELTLRF